MKQSRYISAIPLNGKFILIYSATTDSYLCCRNDEWDTFIQSPKETHELFNALKSIGAIIDDDCNEIDKIRNKMDLNDCIESEIHLHINPTLNCNFNCWYCYENHLPKSKMNESTLRSIIKLIERKTSDPKVNKLIISFFGGEPLMYFDSIAKSLITNADRITSQNNVSLQLHFTTNGYLFNDKIISFLDKYAVSFQITVDGHKDFHDGVRHCGGHPSYDIIMNNVKTLLEHDKNVVLRVNFTDKNIDSVQNILEELTEWPISLLKNLHVDMQQVWQNIDRSNEESIYNKLQILQKYAATHDISMSYNWKVVSMGYSCYADKVNHILVNYNGDIFFCTARDFDTMNRKGYLNSEGYEIWENNSLEKHRNAKFSNPFCQQCRIGALCGGGCRQKALEGMNRHGCPMGFSESDIDDIILKRFEKYIMTK